MKNDEKLFDIEKTDDSTGHGSMSYVTLEIFEILFHINFLINMQLS